MGDVQKNSKDDQDNNETQLTFDFSKSVLNADEKLEICGHDRPLQLHEKSATASKMDYNLGDLNTYSVRTLQDKLRCFYQDNFNLRHEIFIMKEGIKTASKFTEFELAKKVKILEDENEEKYKSIEDKNKLLKNMMKIIDQKDEDFATKTKHLTEQIEMSQKKLEIQQMKIDEYLNREMEICELEEQKRELELCLEANEREFCKRLETLEDANVKLTELNTDQMERLQRYEDEMEALRTRVDLQAGRDDENRQLKSHIGSLKLALKLNEETIGELQIKLANAKAKQRELECERERLIAETNVAAVAPVTGQSTGTQTQVSEPDLVSSSTTSASSFARHEHQHVLSSPSIIGALANRTRLLTTPNKNNNNNDDNTSVLIDVNSTTAHESSVVAASALSRTTEKVAELRKQLEQKESERSQAIEICTNLIEHLRETALFFRKLFENKDFSQLLSRTEMQSLRSFIDDSLNVSQKLSETFLVPAGGESAGNVTVNKSMAIEANELLASNLSTILDLLTSNRGGDKDAVDELVQLPAASDRNNVRQNDSIIQGLRDEIETLKIEIKLRDSGERKAMEAGTETETAATGTETECRAQQERMPISSRQTVARQRQQLRGQQSESEAWSEPDRQVSFERMGGLFDDGVWNLAAKIPKTKYRHSWNNELIVAHSRDTDAATSGSNSSASSDELAVESVSGGAVSYSRRNQQRQHHQYQKAILMVRDEMAKLSVKYNQKCDEFERMKSEAARERESLQMALIEARKQDNKFEELAGRVEDVHKLKQKYLQKNQELKGTIVDLERRFADEKETLTKRIVELQQKADAAAVSDSRLLLEHSRLLTENAVAQKELRAARDRLDQLQAELQDERTARTQLRMQAERDRSELETRLAELEVANAAFQNRCALLECGSTNNSLNRSAATAAAAQQSRRSVALSPIIARADSFDQIQTATDKNHLNESSDYFSEDNRLVSENAIKEFGKENVFLDMSGRNATTPTSTTASLPLTQTAHTNQRPFSSTFFQTAAADLATSEQPFATEANKTIESLRKENAILKSNLQQSKQSLLHTLHELEKANRRRKDVESAICSQLKSSSKVWSAAQRNLMALTQKQSAGAAAAAASSSSSSPSTQSHTKPNDM